MGTGREKSHGISTGDLKRPPHRVRRGPKPRQHGAVGRGTRNRASSTINAAGWSILNRYSQTSNLWRETLRGHEGTTGRCLKTASQTRKLVKNAIIASISHRILLHGATCAASDQDNYYTHKSALSGCGGCLLPGTFEGGHLLPGTFEGAHLDSPSRRVIS